MTWNPDKTSISVQPVVIACGNDAKLWTLFRPRGPQQFVAGDGNQSLFQRTVFRLSLVASETIHVAAPAVVTDEGYRFVVLEQLHDMRVGAAKLICTGAHDTAAVTSIATQAREAYTDPVLVVMPAGQKAAKEEALTQALRQAVIAAAKGSFVILGITPDCAESADSQGGSQATEAVPQFVHKIASAHAERFLAEGGLWSSGMFVVRASAWLQVLTQQNRGIGNAKPAVWQGRESDFTIDNFGVKASPPTALDADDRELVELRSDSLLSDGRSDDPLDGEPDDRLVPVEIIEMQLSEREGSSHRHE